MKLKHLFETAKTLTLRVDNPGGEWLKNKREDNDAAKPNQFGNPSRLGPVTGSWNKHVLLPVDLLAKIKGLNDEQSRVRQNDFDGLKGIMGSTKRLPLTDSGKQYPPFIIVAQDGTPWVSEGNHRIMVAKHLGWKYMPIELRYFTGGEGEHGILAPNKVKAYNTEAESIGYNVEDFHAELKVTESTGVKLTSFAAILEGMHDWSHIDYGIKFDISKLHSNPEIAKKLANKMGNQIHAASTSNNITLVISFRQKTSTARLNLTYDTINRQMHCRLDDTHSFDIPIIDNGYGALNVVIDLTSECAEWLEKKDQANEAK